MFFIFRQALAGECGFMAANLYARSIFGEDALANVSIEKPSDQSGPSVTGHVRIRAKSQVVDVCYSSPPHPPLVVVLFQVSRRSDRSRNFDK